MKRWKWWAPLIIVMLAACSQEHSNRTAVYDNKSPWKIADQEKSLKNAPISKGTMLLPEKFAVLCDTAHLTVNMDGNVSDGRNEVKLPLDEGFYIVKLHYFNLDTTIVLLADVEDGETGRVDAFSLSKQSLRLNWKNALASYNASAGAVDDGILYMGLKDYAYALNSADGKTIWQSSGLLDKTGISKFDSIAFGQNQLFLFGQPLKNQPEKTLEGFVRIDKKSGALE